LYKFVELQNRNEKPALFLQEKARLHKFKAFQLVKKFFFRLQPFSQV